MNEVLRESQGAQFRPSLPSLQVGKTTSQIKKSRRVAFAEDLQPLYRLEPDRFGGRVVCVNRKLESEVADLARTLWQHGAMIELEPSVNPELVIDLPRDLPEWLGAWFLAERQNLRAYLCSNFYESFDCVEGWERMPWQTTSDELRATYAQAKAAQPVCQRLKLAA